MQFTMGCENKIFSVLTTGVPIYNEFTTMGMRKKNPYRICPPEEKQKLVFGLGKSGVGGRMGITQIVCFKKMFVAEGNGDTLQLYQTFRGELTVNIAAM